MFETLESRRLLSVAMSSGSLVGVSASQGNDGTLIVSTDNTYRRVDIIEAGTRGDPGLIASFGPGAVQVSDESGNYVIFNGVSNNPIKATTGSNGGEVHFNGNLHNADINGSGGDDDIVVTDEGAGGTEVHCGGGRNTVQIVFSHHATVHDGGGRNDIYINTDFKTTDTGGYGATSAGGIVTSGNGETVKLGDTAADYISVQVGGGINTIAVYAGNLDVKAGGGFDTLLVQGYTGSTIPPKTFMTDFVDILSDKGIDQVLGTPTV
jgi:hypothetical protein